MVRYGYDSSETKILVASFRQGFDLGYRGPVCNEAMNNLLSTRSRPEIMGQLLGNEVEKGRILGPFDRPPFTDFRVNPLGFVPKRTPGEYRLIVDLSQPKGHSVNSYIPPELSSVSYPGIQDAIDIILELHKQGYKPHLFKLDIKSAFRIIPLNPQVFPLMGLKFDNKFFVNVFLPMGASSSCSIFQRFSDSVAFLLEKHAGVPHVLNYLDDFLGICLSYHNGQMSKSNSKVLGQKIRLPYAEDKEEGPAPVLVFIGIELDCVLLEARLPREKIEKATSLINNILKNPRVKSKRLEQLHGYLNYCAQIIPAGRAFLRSLSAIMFSKSQFITVPKEVRLDLGVWLTFLNDFNGRAMFVTSDWDSEEVLTLETDSSGSWGCGAVLLGEYFSIPWNSNIPRGNLALLELYPVVVATHVWAEKLANKRLIIRSDNMATVHIINKLKSSDSFTMTLVRLFALNQLKFNIWFQASHIPGALNVGPDLLSRDRVSEFLQLFPRARRISPNLPQPLQQRNCLV